jgi:hypothetical protein
MICLKFFLDLVTLMASGKVEFFSYNNEKLDMLAKNFDFVMLIVKFTLLLLLVQK